MGSKTKTKRLKTADQLAAEKLAAEHKAAAAIGLTVERYRRDDWTREQATVRKGAKIEHPFRRISRIARFFKDGWIDKGGQAALERYELLAEASGYGGTRSCLNMAPKGEAGIGAPPAIVRARRDLARIRNLVRSTQEAADALDVTHELLFGLEPAESIMGRLLTGGRDAVRAKGRTMVAATALALQHAFDARLERPTPPKGRLVTEGARIFAWREQNGDRAA